MNLKITRRNMGHCSGIRKKWWKIWRWHIQRQSSVQWLWLWWLCICTRCDL